MTHMTISQINDTLTPADHGIIRSFVDCCNGLGDDGMFYSISHDLFLSPDLDFTKDQAKRYAHFLVSGSEQEANRL